ncbi:protein brambleberry [Etheostoma cragini]|uniref:protein brambleberry n=1 Tax=Etheostoma cragini TaxID=417921 RepID=UPI00155DFDB8|nr:protein brambleberry [Etheostoma cragini]
MAHLQIHRLCFLLVSILACQCPAVSGLFEWLKGAAAPPPAPPPPPAAVVPALLAKDAQFEMATTDERFLSEAKQLELSPLDSCHFKVVAQLKASCESLPEEQLAKLGVVLFNCQAAVEGRKTYPCTEEMTIKECTADMDSDTWNAYHIVSNRARSVCYATRQQLFRRRAEHTVNALISTATSQLETMKDLKDGQLELKELTAASLDKLLDGHSALQEQQGKLFEGQGQMESSLRDNLERLGQEKALIASGQELVAQLIQGITKRMGESFHVFMNLTLHKFSIFVDSTNVQLFPRQIQCLQYSHLFLTTFLLFTSAGQWFGSHLWAYLQSRGKPAAPLPLAPWAIVEPQRPVSSSSSSYPPSSTPQKDKSDGSIDQDDLLNQDSFISGNFGISAASPLHRKPIPESRFTPIVGTPNHSTPRLVPRPLLSEARVADIPLRNLGGVFDFVIDSHDSMNDSRSASPTPSLSNSSISGRQLCNGITKTGKVCKKRAVPGQDYCRVHEGGLTSYVAK